MKKAMKGYAGLFMFGCLQSVLAQPEIQTKSLQFDVFIEDHYARTIVTADLENIGTTIGETQFSQIIPKGSYISKFVMTIDGRTFRGDTKEKAEAKQTYDDAVNEGRNAGLLKQRGQNSFDIAVNLNPGGRAIVELHHEKLLVRRLSKYEYDVNLLPFDLDDAVNTVVNINVKMNSEGGQSFRKLEVEAPDWAMCKEVACTASSSKEYMWQLNRPLRTKTILRFYYEVQDSTKGSLTVDDDGYFRHAFAPPTGTSDDITALPKRVVFTLDMSGSMSGRKWEQTVQAAHFMLDQLDGAVAGDMFNVVLFDSSAISWRPSLQETTITNIFNAKKWISESYKGGSTNIDDALKVSLKILNDAGARWSDNYANMVVFLSDGSATAGSTNGFTIVENVERMNEGRASIFSLAFGRGADYELVRQIARNSMGNERKILEDDNASESMQEFWREISTPLLKDVSVSYKPDQGTVTKYHPPIERKVGYLFLGSELLYSGQFPKEAETCSISVTGRSKGGEQRTYELPSVSLQEMKNIKRTISVIRTWSMLALTDLRDLKMVVDPHDNAETDEATQLKEQALDISLEQELVTPWTSMVIVGDAAPTEQPTDQPTLEPTVEGQIVCLKWCDSCAESGTCDSCKPGYKQLGDTAHDREYGQPGSCFQEQLYYPANPEEDENWTKDPETEADQTQKGDTPPMVPPTANYMHYGSLRGGSASMAGYAANGMRGDASSLTTVMCVVLTILHMLVGP